MKLYEKLILPLFLFLLILAGCNPQTKQQSAVPIENPTWEVVSTKPADFNISYSDPEEYASFALDKLIAYFLGADGFYREGSSDEIFKRFIDAPNTVLNYIALLPDDQEDMICNSIISTHKNFYSDSFDLKAFLEEYNVIYSSGKVRQVLDAINNKYSASIT